VKARFVTYAVAGALTLGSVCGTQSALAAERPSGGNTTEKIPHAHTGRAVPIPRYVQGSGPWANLPTRQKLRSAPVLISEFCPSSPSDLSTVCLGLNHLLRLLRFGV
jgi:hypothetical protein